MKPNDVVTRTWIFVLGSKLHEDSQRMKRPISHWNEKVIGGGEVRTSSKKDAREITRDSALPIAENINNLRKYQGCRVKLCDASSLRLKLVFGVWYPDKVPLFLYKTVDCEVYCYLIPVYWIVRDEQTKMLISARELNIHIMNEIMAIFGHHFILRELWLFKFPIGIP